MPIAIRLVRRGKKNAPVFRIQAGSKEVLGSFNPQHQPPAISLNKERINYWVKQGVQISPAVKALLQGKYKYRQYVPRSKEALEGPPKANLQTPPQAQEKLRERETKDEGSA